VSWQGNCSQPAAAVLALQKAFAPPMSMLLLLLD
jgi:hypothetical protein